MLAIDDGRGKHGEAFLGLGRYAAVKGDFDVYAGRVVSSEVIMQTKGLVMRK